MANSVVTLSYYFGYKVVTLDFIPTENEILKTLINSQNDMCNSDSNVDTNIVVEIQSNKNKCFMG